MGIMVPWSVSAQANWGEAASTITAQNFNEIGLAKHFERTFRIERRLKTGQF